MSFIKKIRHLPDAIGNRITFLRFRPEYAQYPAINGRILLYSGRGGKISFGRNVRINSSLRSNPIGGDTVTILYAQPGACISIGNNCGISNSAIIAKTSVVIEDDVMIGGSCKIYDNDFHSVNYSERMRHPDPGIGTKPVLIRQGAFIGAHSIILKGVTIGRHSVIGAGSVVTHDVPDNEIWAGNPAVFVRRIN